MVQINCIKWLMTLLVVFYMPRDILVNAQATTLDDYLITANRKLGHLYNRKVEDSWRMEVIGPSEEIMKSSEETTKDIMQYVRMLFNEIGHIDKELVGESILKRQLEKLPKLGYEALSSDDLQQLSETTAEMSNIYKNVKLCSYQDKSVCNLTLIPHVQDILHTTNDVNEIEYYWFEWILKTGLKVKGAFSKFIDLYKSTANLNGYAKASNFWFRNFDEDSSEVFNELGFIMQEMRPLFKAFHAHVRHILRERYGSDLIKKNLPYPQHLAEVFIGRVYRQSNIADIELPFPSKPPSNLTAAMSKLGYTQPEDLYKIASKFYRSVGMPPLDENFWQDNAVPKANADETYLTCWNKAWHFYENLPTKLSYCPNVDEERLINMFEALSDVYYSEAYKNQPTLFQEEPLPNFSESIGKIFSRAATSPRYLEKIGLIKPNEFDFERRINRLYLQGLKNVFLLPIFFVIDKYRVKILDNEINAWDNCAYWDLIEEFTGAMAPGKRTNLDYDAPAKLLVEVDDEYSSYVIGTIAQFQIFKKFCAIIGQYERGNDQLPLDLCDLSDHPEIGKIVTKAMSMGSSKTWREVLYMLTGEDSLKMDGFLEYFKPLFDWLVQDNRINNAEVGWIESYQCER